MSQECFDFPHMLLLRLYRLFFALQPNTRDARAISNFAGNFLDEHGIGAKIHDRDRLHVSLQSAGDHKRFHKRNAYGAKLVGKRISLEPFELEFTSIESFGAQPGLRGEKPRYPLVLRTDDESVRELYRKLGDGMMVEKMRASADFKPHMTLCYLPFPFARETIKPMRIDVSEFLLIHSLVGLHKYEILGRWSLHAPIQPWPRLSHAA